MTGFCGISFVSQSRQTIGDHYFWVDSLSLKSKLAKKFYDEFLRNLLSLPIPANYWRPLLFLGGFAFFKKKVGKKIHDEFLRNLLCLPVPTKLLAAIISQIFAQIFVIYKNGNRSLTLSGQRFSVFCMESTPIFHNFESPFPRPHIRRFSLHRFHLRFLSSWKTPLS